MRTIIHIGQHKTGTTSIQHFLRKKRAELRKEGLYVPNSIAGCKHPSHYMLNGHVLDGNRYSSMKETLLKTKSRHYLSTLHRQLARDISKHYLLAEKQKCKDVIWSNEGLYLLNSSREYWRLRLLFEKYSSVVTCVCCFRDVESFKSAYVRQLVRQGLGSLEIKDSYRYTKDDSWLFDYPKKIATLNEVFDQVIIFDYSKTDNVGEFFKAIGYSVDGVASLRLNVEKRPGSSCIDGGRKLFARFWHS